MTKLEVGKKYWIKAEYKKINDFNDLHHWFEIAGALDGLVMLGDVSEVKEVIQEREKVTIPKFVAEWIEECENNKYHLSVSIQKGIDSSSQELSRWLFGKNNQDTFARAWLDGYEIEKEPLYYVKIPNVYHGYFGYSERFDNYSFYNKEDATEIRFELTEEEIKQNHEWAWKFAVPVEEER